MKEIKLTQEEINIISRDILIELEMNKIDREKVSLYESILKK